MLGVGHGLWMEKHAQRHTHTASHTQRHAHSYSYNKKLSKWCMNAKWGLLHMLCVCVRVRVRVRTLILFSSPGTFNLPLLAQNLWFKSFKHNFQNLNKGVEISNWLIVIVLFRHAKWTHWNHTKTCNLLFVFLSHTFDRYLSNLSETCYGVLRVIRQRL